MRSGFAYAIGVASVPDGGAGAPPPDPSLSLTVLEDGAVSIDGAAGAITIEILAPAEFAGTYTQDIDGRPLTAGLVTADRFVCLVRPMLSGASVVGATLTVSPGLWIYAGAEPTFTYQWNANGTAIASATSDTYTLTASEAEQTVTATVTASEGGASTAVDTLGVIVSSPVTFEDDFSTYLAWNQDLLVDPPGYTAISANPGPTVVHYFGMKTAEGMPRLQRGGDSRVMYVFAPVVLTSDQIVETEFGGLTVAAENRQFGVVSRASGPDNAASGYQFFWNSFNNTLQLAKRVSGVFTSLDTWNNGGAGYVLQVGDRLKITVTDTSLVGELRPAATGVWQTVVSATDSELTSGDVGMMFWAQLSAPAAQAYVSYFRALG